MGGDEASDPVLVDEPAQALIRHAAGDGDGVDVLDALLQHLSDELLGGELPVPVSEHDDLAVMDAGHGLLTGHDL